MYLWFLMRNEVIKDKYGNRDSHSVFAYEVLRTSQGRPPRPVSKSVSLALATAKAKARGAWGRCVGIRCCSASKLVVLWESEDFLWKCPDFNVLILRRSFSLRVCSTTPQEIASFWKYLLAVNKPPAKRLVVGGAEVLEEERPDDTFLT